MKKKTIAALMAFVLIIGATVGVTLAYLSDKTSDVVNTFTVGKVDIDLYEHDLKTDGTLDKTKEVLGEDTYKIIPGSAQPKDPTVDVIAGSEECYLFIKVVEKNNIITAASGNTAAVKYVDWKIATGWTKLSETSENGVVTYVYYQVVSAADATSGKSFQVLAGGDSTNTTGQVTYSADLTAAQIAALYKLENNNYVIDTTKQPTLTLTAYAVQKANVDNEEAAWNAVKDLSGTYLTQTTESTTSGN